MAESIAKNIKAMHEPKPWQLVNNIKHVIERYKLVATENDENFKKLNKLPV